MLPKTESTDPSVIFITMHKAGSVIANKILSRILFTQGFVHVNFASEAFKLGTKVQDYCSDRKHLFRQNGYYFGAFRETTSDWFGDLSHNKIIIQIRDPRDCIVSSYFSFKYSHPAPGNGDLTPLFNTLRSDVQKTKIDDYVLTKVHEYQTRYNVIRSLMDRHPNVILLKYEDMVTDFPKWYKSVINFLNIPYTDETYQAILSFTDFSVEDENVHRHKRQVIPGDYKRKLNNNTQQVLTNSFQTILTDYNY